MDQGGGRAIGARPVRWSADHLAIAAGAVSVTAVWILTHPYVGVSRDANGRGILIASPTRFEVGEEVELDLYLSKQKKIVVKGHVRRVETTDNLPHELWRYRLGIEFDGVEEPQLN